MVGNCVRGGQKNSKKHCRDMRRRLSVHPRLVKIVASMSKEVLIYAKQMMINQHAKRLMDATLTRNFKCT